jgi:hypothetical protein
MELLNSFHQARQSKQASLFDDRIQQASSDGELVEKEYYACAYNIYS